MSTVPDKKVSKSRTKRRYKKWAYEKKKKLLNRVNLVKCPQCGEKKLSHTICQECGAYNKVKKAVSAETKKPLAPKKETAKKVVKKEVKKTEKKPAKKKDKK
ncbi:MAG: 50S ribosomal protein L32 [Candidatus Gracilibacteria bacterium]|nr:50S ribosomal protein L32 [Candidatus Gracilibacteria bacterium]